ncbi:MAG: non-canonical purine NTP pyrophosphatase [Desulfobulbaceae bacterium]
MVHIIVLATRNAGKVKEFQQLLEDFPVQIKNLNDFGPIPEVEEDGTTFDENAYKKASFAAKVLGLPTIADDSGLVVEALGGAPGVIECVISIAVPSGPALTYEGRCEGEISTEPKGVSGFGYDPVFYFPEYGKTFAELTSEEKNKVSHRGKALAQVAAEFDKILAWLEARLAEVKPPKPDHAQFEHNDWSEDKMV